MLLSKKYLLNSSKNIRIRKVGISSTQLVFLDQCHVMFCPVLLIYCFTHRFGFVLQSCSTTYRTFWKCLSDLPVSTKSVTSLTPHSAPSFTTFTAATLRTLEMCAALVSESVTGSRPASRT